MEMRWNKYLNQTQNTHKLSLTTIQYEADQQLVYEGGPWWPGF